MNPFAQPLSRYESSGGRLSPSFARVATLVVLAFRIRRERNQLADMTDAALADIGVSRADANREAARELFDIPASRKRRLFL